MEVEELQETAKAPKANLGDFQKLGWYVLLLCALQEFMVLSQLSNMTFMIYGGYSPTLKSCGKVQFAGSDRERCQQWLAVRNSSNCEPLLEAQFESVNVEFNLICEDGVLVKNSISFQMLGVMVGAVAFGQLSELFGRKRILILCVLGMFSFSVISSFVATFAAFNIARFFVMAFTGGQMSVQHVFIQENLPKKHRVWIVTVFSYSPNYIIFSLIAFFARDWRNLSRYSALISNLPAAFLLVFLVNESPRWFVQKGRLEEARDTLLAIDRFNGTFTEKRLAELDDVLEKERSISETQNRRRRYSFVHLFYTWTLTSYILTLSFSLMSASVISYALMFNMDKLSGSIYLNSVFFGIFRYAMNILVGLTDYFIPRAGRKPIHNVAMGFILFALASVFISTVVESDRSAWITRVATLSAAAMTSQLFLVSGIATTELFPTAVRNLAVSFTAILSRTGSIVAPHLFYTALLWKPLPYAIMLAVVAVEIASFNLAIPETKGSHLVDHMPGPEERIFEEMSDEVAKCRKSLADFPKLGWYLLYICVVNEVMVLVLLSNLAFMIYGGASPKVVGCGEVSLLESENVCADLRTLRANDSCDLRMEAQFESINYEFELVCEDSLLVKNSISFQMIGMMFGSAVLGQLSDRYGRKRILTVSIAGVLVSMLASYFSQSLLVFNVTRFAAMFFTGGQSSSQLTFLMEVVPKKHRVWITTVLSTSPNYIILAGLAYLGQDWRTLSLYVSVAAAISIVMLAFVFESPRWFVQQGRLDEALSVVIRVDQLNGSYTPERAKEMEIAVEYERELIESRSRKKYSFLHLFYTWKLASYILTLSFTLFTASLLSYALLFNLDKLSGSIYLNSLIFGVLRWTLNAIVGLVDFFIPKAGRRLVHHITMGFILLALSIILFVVIFDIDAPVLVRITTLSACAMCSQLFLVAGVATAELFPTAVRTVAISFSQIMNKLGTVAAPHLFTTALIWQPMPYAIMIALVVVEVLAYSVLVPESKGMMNDRMPSPEERIFAKRSKETVLLGGKDVEEQKLTAETES